MSQTSRFRIDELLDNDPTPAQPDAASTSQTLGEHYATPGYGRNLCFVWEDGRRMFLGYAYLVSCEYAPSERTIKLVFTTHQVTLKGLYLDNMYEGLMSQMVRIIGCEDPRYNATANKDHPRVNSIEIVKIT